MICFFNLIEFDSVCCCNGRPHIKWNWNSKQLSIFLKVRDEIKYGLELPPPTYVLDTFVDNWLFSSSLESGRIPVI